MPEWLDKIRAALGLGPEPAVKLYCPETGEQIATEDTAPWSSEHSHKHGLTKATYLCPECITFHQYHWGPPAPVYVGDDGCPSIEDAREWLEDHGDEA